MEASETDSVRNKFTLVAEIFTFTFSIIFEGNTGHFSSLGTNPVIICVIEGCISDGSGGKLSSVDCSVMLLKSTGDQCITDTRNSHMFVAGELHAEKHEEYLPGTESQSILQQ